MRKWWLYLDKVLHPLVEHFCINIFFLDLCLKWTLIISILFHSLCLDWFYYFLLCVQGPFDASPKHAFAIFFLTRFHYHNDRRIPLYASYGCLPRDKVVPPYCKFLQRTSCMAIDRCHQNLTVLHYQFAQLKHTGGSKSLAFITNKWGFCFSVFLFFFFTFSHFHHWHRLPCFPCETFRH